MPSSDDRRGTPRERMAPMGDMEDIVSSTCGIELLLLKLNTAKGGGPDGFTNHFFKICARSIAPFLKILFEKSLAEASLPNDWKISAVVPVHKSGLRSDVVNYRPISLTCVACKVLEHILYTSIVAHMNLYSLFNPFQHGFRKNLSS